MCPCFICCEWMGGVLTILGPRGLAGAEVVVGGIGAVVLLAYLLTMGREPKAQ